MIFNISEYFKIKGCYKNNKLRVFYNDLIMTEIPKEYLNRFDYIKIHVDDRDGTIKAECEDFNERTMNLLSGIFLGDNFPRKNRYTERELIFVENPPLCGHNAFGLIDKNTNIIQIRPITGCNQNCVFCSVDEGKYSKTRIYDFFVDYKCLLYQFKELLSRKKLKTTHEKVIEAHIDGQSEPTIYPNILELISELSEIPQVRTISIQTTGTLLNEKFIRKLAESGLSRINISIHTLNPEKARILSGNKEYDIEKIKKICESVISYGIELMPCPVWLGSFNEKDIIDIILFSKSLGCKKIGIQKFISYKFGRTPYFSEPHTFDDFYKKLRYWEKITGFPLQLTLKDLNIIKIPTKWKRYRKNQIIKVKIIYPGRMKNECIGTVGERLVQIIGKNLCDSYAGKKVRVKILKDEFSLLTAVPVI